MKNIITILLFSFTVFTLRGQDQKESTRSSNLPSVELKTLDGKTILTDTLSNHGKPLIISFWALWCKPCIKELSNIANVYEEWVEETGVRLVAVSIDDPRSSSRVKPFVDGKSWEFDVLLDPNSDFKRAMNVNLIPHTFLLDGSGKVVWQHTSYTEGSEIELIQMVRKLNQGQTLQE